MPNYVTNNVTILCPNGNAQRVKKFVASGDRVFDFEKIAPAPPSMNMVSGSLTDMAIVAYITDNCSLEISKELLEHAESIHIILKSKLTTFYDRTKKSIKKDGADKLYNFSASETLYLTLYDAGKIYCENLITYGAIDWYDYNCNNWGTKWNACEPDLFSESDTELQYSFDTAWSMPHPIFCKLTETFKDITIKVEYADEDFGSNCGRVEYSGGREVDVYIPSTYKEGQELAAEILGYDLDSDFKYSEKLGHYVWAEDFEEIEEEYDRDHEECPEKSSGNSAEEDDEDKESEDKLVLETESGITLTF